MAFEAPDFCFSFVAAADLSASQFRMVNIDATGKVALAGAAGRVAGVLQNPPKATEAASVCLSGISKVVSGAAIAAGATVESDATGRAITRAAGVPVGIALEASSAAGVVIAMLIRPNTV